MVIPLPSELWASWKAGSGARDGYLLRLSGQVEKTITLGPGALNATFPGPLPAGPYTLELRVLAGPYDAWARASAWLNGESGLMGNRMRPCPGAPAWSGSWVLTLQNLHPLQILLPSPDKATGPRCSWMGWGPPGSPGGRHCSTLREPQASSETSPCHLLPRRSLCVSWGLGPTTRWTLSRLWETLPRAPQAIQVSVSHCPALTLRSGGGGGLALGREIWVEGRLRRAGKGLHGATDAAWPPYQTVPLFRAPGTTVTGCHRQGQPL